MPTTHIDYSKAHEILNLKHSALPDGACIISTPFGLCIIEIQGELNVPLLPPSSEGIDPEFLELFAKVNNMEIAVKFGALEFDERDPSKVVMFVGKSQRLLGTVETLREPLGVLKVPNEKVNDSMEIVDIIKKKIIFRQRPLPIM